MSQKMPARLREIAPSSVDSSRNLADVFLDIAVYFASYQLQLFTASNQLQLLRLIFGRYLQPFH